LQCIIVIRLLRIGAFLRELNAVQIFEKTIRHLVESLASLMMVLYTVYLLYSELGTLIFGGWINMDTINLLVAQNSNIEASYVYLNFNDLASGYITLFSIMVNNNWQFVVFMYSLQTTHPI
jgi:hypothetical protein